MHTWNKRVALHHPGILFTPPLFPKITRCPSIAKNYRTTKNKKQKKGSSSFYATTAYVKIINCPSKSKNYRTTKKKVLRAFTPFIPCLSKVGLTQCTMVSYLKNLQIEPILDLIFSKVWIQEIQTY